MIAITFQPYLEAQTLIVLAHARSKSSEGIILHEDSKDDYTLCPFDSMGALICHERDDGYEWGFFSSSQEEGKRYSTGS